MSYALSPSHLLHGRCLIATHNGAHYEIVSAHDCLVLHHKHQEHLFNQFFSLRCKTYLLSLQEHHSIKMRQSKKSTIAVGDVVVLKNDSTKRQFWKLAFVLLTGSDEVVRATMVRTVDSEGRSPLLRGSIQHLIPTEVRTKPNIVQLEVADDTPIHVNSRSSEAPVSNNDDATRMYSVDLVDMPQWLEKSIVN